MIFTFDMAGNLKLPGKPVKLTVQKVGQSLDKAEVTDSFVYDLKCIDVDDRYVTFKVYGIQKISNQIKPVNFDEINDLFCKEEL